MGCSCSKEPLVDVQVVAPSRSCGGRKTSCGAEAAAVEWLDPLPAGSALRRADSNRSLASIYFDAVSQADSVESFLTAFCNTPTSVASSFTDTFFDAGGFDGSQPRTPGTSAGGASACSASAGGAHSYAHGPGHGHAHVEHASARAAAVEAAAAAGASPAELVLRQYKQGDIFLCKAVGELVSYWKASGLGLDQLEEQLLQAEAKIGDLSPAGGRGRERQQQQQHHHHQDDESADEGDPSCDEQQQCRHGGQQQGGQQAQAAAGRRPRRRRWVSTSGDAMLPGARPLAPEGLGCGGSDLFSAAHVMAHVRTAAELMKQLDESRGWRQVAYGALQLWHHHDRDKGLQHFKVHCVIDEPMLNVVCLCREVDLVTTWNPTLNAMKCMLQASLSELLVYMGLWVPWPLTQPAILIRALGMDLLASEGAMIISMQDLGDVLPPDLNLVPGHEARKRYSLHPSCFRFEPLPPDPSIPGGPPRCDTTVIATLDSKKVPVNDTVISFLLKVFAPVVYRTVVATCARLFHRSAPDDSPLMRRMRERADLYLPQALSIDRHLRARGHAPQLPTIAGLRGVAAEALEGAGGGAAAARAVAAAAAAAPAGA